MAGRVDTENDPLFPTHVPDWRTTEEIEGNDAVFREGKWWWHFNWWARRKNLFRERERIRKNKDIRSFFSSQTTDPGL